MIRTHLFIALLAPTIFGALSCSSADSEIPANETTDPTNSKADQGELTDVAWANTFFLTQVYDARWNPSGMEADADANNCGPASLAMLMASRGTSPTDLEPEAAIDHARAMMYPDYPDIQESSLRDGAILSTDGDLVFVDDDNHPVYFELIDDNPSVTQGIINGGGTPEFGHSWSDLDTLLEAHGSVIALGHITEAWRLRFSGDYATTSPGAIQHFIALFPATNAEEFLVCDPMHSGGAMIMTKTELQTFFQSPVNVYETTIRMVAWGEPVVESEKN